MTIIKRNRFRCECENPVVIGDPRFCLVCFGNYFERKTRGIDQKIFGGRDWTRELVRMRDNHTCQSCGKVWKEGERRFDIHHLKGLCGKKSKKYDRVSEMDNLITLCHKCHFRHPEISLKLRKKLKRRGVVSV